MKRHLSTIAALLFLSVLISADTKPDEVVPKDAVVSRGNHYKLFLATVDWQTARTRCERMGGRLVCVHDAETQEFVKGLAKGQRIWIGLSDQIKEGRWQWVDGTLLNFNAWGDGQPDAAHADEDFALLRPDGKWNDATIIGPSTEDRVIGFICEWPATEGK